MDAKKNGSIVKVDHRPYRIIAQENWGLSDEQMKGMHVHHRIPLSKGGTNDPSNLYVCSPSMHAWVWHKGLFAIITDASKIAQLGGLAGGKKGGNTTKERGTGIFAPGVQSAAGKLGGSLGGAVCKQQNLGIFALTSGERSANTARQWCDEGFKQMMRESSSKVGRKCFEEKKGLFDPENLGKGAKTTNSTLWVDPDYPELGAHHFNTLSRLQKERGLPHGKMHRVKALKDDDNESQISYRKT
jgi:hypothetical protein